MHPIRLAIAFAAVVSAAASAEDVRQFPRTDVEAAFARGAPLLETDAYKVHASRREKAGLAEVHEHETDILRVLAGTARLVTGGRLVDAKETAPGELRGASIANGEARDLAPA